LKLSFYFFRLEDLAEDFFADFDDGGGGVLASRFTASSKLMFNLKSMALGITIFYLVADSLPLFFPHQKSKGKISLTRSTRRSKV